MGGHCDISKGDSLVTNSKKVNSKKKKRGRNKKVGVKFQIKKEEPVSLNINKKWDNIKPPQKRKETEGPGAEENDATQNRASDQVKSAKKPRKGKRRNNKDFTFSNPKVGKSVDTLSFNPVSFKPTVCVVW